MLILNRLSDPNRIKVDPYFVIDWESVSARQMIPPFVPNIKDPGDTYYFDNYSERREPDVGAEFLHTFEGF